MTEISSTSKFTGKSPGDSRGTLILVTGPSGVGKDSLLAGATDLLQQDGRILFATRVITRPASQSGEQHIAVTEAEFLQRKAAGEFWIDWHAHETRYALPIESRTALANGVSVLANISRTVIEALAAAWENTVVIEINADPERIRHRLQNRAREDAAQINKRLAREVPPAPDSVTLLKVDNSGSREAGIEAFNALITSILSDRPNGKHQAGTTG